MAVKAATLSLALLALSSLSGSHVNAQATSGTVSRSASNAVTATSRGANPGYTPVEHPTAEEMAVWYWTGAQSVYWVSILFYFCTGAPFDALCTVGGL